MIILVWLAGKLISIFYQENISIIGYTPHDLSNSNFQDSLFSSETHIFEEIHIIIQGSIFDYILDFKNICFN